MPDVFLNGRFLPRDDARISAFDAGLQHAVGLFETLQARVSGGEALIRSLDRHMTRLADSARLLGLSDALRTEALGDAVLATVERAGYPRARARLTITGGDLNMLARARAAPQPPGAPPAHDPTVLIDVQPATDYPAPMFEDGVGVAIADAKANPFNPFEGHKTLNYWWRLRALQDAASKRVAEALVFTITNHLAGACVSNAFIAKDGALYTPIARGQELQTPGDAGHPAPDAPGVVLPSPVLPGITRAEVIEYADDAGIPIHPRMLTITDVLDADELFLTNSSWGILPVVRVEAAPIGPPQAKGRVGPITRALRARWLQDWDEGML